MLTQQNGKGYRIAIPLGPLSFVHAQGHENIHLFCRQLSRGSIPFVLRDSFRLFGVANVMRSHYGHIVFIEHILYIAMKIRINLSHSFNVAAKYVEFINNLITLIYQQI